MNTEEDEFRRIEREIVRRALPDPIHHADTCGVEYITGWNDCRQAMLVEQPAQRKPLTNEQISKLSKGHITRNGFARAIEAAHGIKEIT